MRLTTVALCLIVAGLAAYSPPLQRESMASTLDTVTDHPLPDALHLALAPCDDSVAILELRCALEGELKHLAIEISDEAAIVKIRRSPAVAWGIDSVYAATNGIRRCAPATLMT